jgi:hypothetical protein
LSTLKAYEVREPDEGHCVIRFATNSATARREGAAELDTDWEGVESCRRMPQFDAYAPGPVPPLVLIKHGWWFECSYIECGSRIGSDSEEHDEDTDEALSEPVAIGQRVFCCAEHAARQLAWWRGRAAAEAALCELIYTKYPAAHVIRAHVYGDRLEPSEYHNGLLVGGVKCSAEFKLPGLQYPVSYHFGEEKHVYVSNVDVEAFTALYGPKS